MRYDFYVQEQLTSAVLNIADSHAKHASCFHVLCVHLTFNPFVLETAALGAA